MTVAHFTPSLVSSVFLSINKSLGSPFASESGFTIKRPEQLPRDKVYTTFEQLNSDFAEKLLHPGDLKSNVERYLNTLLEPIRKKFESPELKKLVSQAYPQESASKKKAAVSNGPSSGDQ